MKRLFFLLCFLNLIFLLWQFHIGGLNPETPQLQQVSSILLLDEYRRARQGAQISAVIDHRAVEWRQIETDRILADLRNDTWQTKAVALSVAKKSRKSAERVKTVEAAKPAAKIGERKCFDAGPFADESGLKKWLTASTLDSKQITQKDSVVASDYQVYYPAAKKPEQTQANKAMLLDKGLQDIWMIPDGELKGGYSLGVFREKQRAVNFKNQLSEKGIQAEIKQRDKTKPQWFVRVMLDKAKLPQYQAAGVKLAACPAN